MSKKPSKTPVSDQKTEISGAPAQDVGRQVRAYTLQERRGLALGGLEEAMERVWRNCKYPQSVTFDQYYRMYARNNVAARVIETFPDYCWSAVPIVTDGGGSESRFSKRAQQLLASQVSWQDGIAQPVLALLKQLDVLGGIGGESLLVFGFRDGGKIGSPVNPSQGAEIAWIKLLHNGQFEVDKRDEDESSPTFGDALIYKTKSFTSVTDLNFCSQIQPGVEIHASRCVHFKESNGLGYGTSRIQKCYNQLLDITKLSGASAEVYWLGAFSGLSIETDPASQLDDEAYDRMKEDTSKYFDGLARAMILDQASAKLLFPAIVSPKDHFDLQIAMISIATGIPRRLLIGTEAAKLASQQDSLNVLERVKNRREMVCTPRAISPFIQRCIGAGALPQPKGGGFVVTWPLTQSIAMNERADASRNMTAAWLSYFSSGMAEVVPFRTYLLNTCGYSEAEAEDIAARCDVKKWKTVAKMAQAAKAPGQTGDGGTPQESIAADVRALEAVVDELVNGEAPLVNAPAQPAGKRRKA